MVSPRRNDAPVLIVAGETSSDRYGALLVQTFKKHHPSTRFFGIGGKQMAKEGVDLLYTVRDISLVGFEIVSHFSSLLKIFRRLDREIILRKPVAAVLIDSPDFNLRLAKKLKKRSIPVLYFIGPTIWAWRRGRLKTIKKNVKKMLLIFPFEEKIYQDHKIPAAYVGHPLKDVIHLSLSKQEFYQKHGLDKQKRLISLLPGSRKGELKFHMPILLEAIKKIHSVFNVQFLLLKAEHLDDRLFSAYLPSPVQDFKMVTEDKYEAMAYSDLILAACGTANLEAVFLDVPLISFYRIWPFYYWAGVKFVKIKDYSITNILAGEKIIPELIQKHFTAENLSREVQKILESESGKAEMLKHFKNIKKSLGEQSAFQNVVDELKQIIAV